MALNNTPLSVLLPSLSALLLLQTASAQSALEIDAWSYRAGYRTSIQTRISGTPAEPYGLFRTDISVTDFSLDQASLLSRGAFDAAGRGRFDMSMPDIRLLPSNYGIRLWLVTRGRNGLDAVSAGLPLRGAGGTNCQDFDPDYKLGLIEPVPGEIVTSQWSEVNMTISAVNPTAGHPDVAVIFDSGAPTGGDDDLRTPGTGPGNDTALGQLIVIAENDDDNDFNGLIDIPDDEQNGGILRFDFGEPYRMCSATLVDIDDGAQSELRFYIGDAMKLETIPVVDLGDNSVQVITFDKSDVRAFEVVLGGSGGIANLGMIPCPMILDFDESPFGRPMSVEAGEWIDDDFQFMGVTVTALNATAGHPQKAILFNSEAPTGEDDDLITPGTGINNTDPLGKVLIIAEDDIDMNMDGLVDDPDDENGGGQITFDFDEDVTFLGTSVLDVDGTERDVFEFFNSAGDRIGRPLEIGSLGDNSVQFLSPAEPIRGVRRININLTGSGALARLRWCPDSNAGTTQTP